MASEQWLPIPGFEEYQISNHGIIVSTRRKKRKSLGFYNGRGYREILLQVNNRKQRFMIHRLVMLAFVGPSNLQVNHKNGIKDDNRLENLEYCTNAENMAHAKATGLYTHGEMNGNSKLNAEAVRYIRKHYKMISQKETNADELCKKFGVSRSTLISAKNGKTWSHV